MKKIFMEDVKKTIIDIVDDIENVTLGEITEEYIWDALEKHITKLCGYPEYRNHN